MENEISKYLSFKFLEFVGLPIFHSTQPACAAGLSKKVKKLVGLMKSLDLTAKS